MRKDTVRVVFAEVSVSRMALGAPCDSMAYERRLSRLHCLLARWLDR